MKNKAQAIRDVQYFGEEGGVVPAIDHAATSTFLNPQDMEKVFSGELQGCYLYSRHTNPTVNAFSKKVAAMEGFEAALGVASGMAAITCAVSQVMMGGGHIICSNTIYGGTYALFANILPKQNIEVTFVDPSKPEEFKKAIKKNTKLIYTEMMSNPLLAICDLKEISKIAKSKNIKLMVDNTFSPLIFTPKDFGADIVIHSCTKYISGASDLIAGVICSSEEFIGELIDVNTGCAMLYGPVMDSRVAYELFSRLDHLPVRMKAHGQAARYLVDRLNDEGIDGVTYPALSSHPDHEVFKSMQNSEYGAGAIITVDCKTSVNAIKMAKKLQEEKFGLFAVSLGFSRTLMSCPAASTSSEIPEDQRTAIGLKDGLLRLSIGIIGDNEVLADKFIAAYKDIIGT
ncbi:MAG: aminotransferase class I/II-fold pyridoxal phosphate-dependent enzyme [Bacteriovoracaceae bacterium]|jgi:methionine-gamma-lyase|nr:aminotransferase class I/II-fold pyridoxal phosphate-dependent enzyme [Bacteriovoracaceae bacterium]